MNDPVSRQDPSAAPSDAPIGSTERRRETFADKRIKRETDFRAVYRFRIRVFNERLALCCRPTSPDSPSRLGLSVSKKIGKAFVRNRWKRLLREVFRKNFADLPQGFDFIAIPQRQEPLPSFATLADDFRRLAARCAKKSKKRAEISRDETTAARGAETNAETPVEKNAVQ